MLTGNNKLSHFIYLLPTDIKGDSRPRRLCLLISRNDLCGRMVGDGTVSPGAWNHQFKCLTSAETRATERSFVDAFVNIGELALPLR